MRKQYIRILRVFFCRKVRTSRAELEISQEELAGRLLMAARTYIDLEQAKNCCSGISERKGHGRASQLHQQLHCNCEYDSQVAFLADPLLIKNFEHRQGSHGEKIAHAVVNNGDHL